MAGSVPLEALVQACVLKNASRESFRLPATSIVFDAGDADVGDRLRALDAVAQSGSQRIVPFVSLEIASRIQRQYPALCRNLVFSPERLAFHRVSVVMGEMLLNQRHLLVTWASLPDRVADLVRALGPSLFVRPDSARKSFTGFAVSAERLLLEHSALSQTEHVSPEELCVVAPAQALSPVEWRFWVVDGHPITCAPYRWDDPSLTGVESTEVADNWRDGVMAPPPAVGDFARTAAARTELVDSALVMDVAVSEAGPRVIELNPLSTSGFHPGIELDALLAALQDVFA